jgi:hypothetical protein
MISSLPNRPLYEPEADTLTEEGPIDLVTPGSPASVQEDEDGTQRVHDLLIFIDETVAALAYTDEENGWTLIAKETDENDDAYELAHDQLLEYRGYDGLNRKEALKRAVVKLYGLPEEAIEANPEELASLGEE